MAVRLGVLAAGALAALALSAQAGAQKPCSRVHTVAGVKFTTYCGPARVTLHVRGKTYRIAGGFCSVDPNGHFHILVGSFDSDRLVGRALNKTLRLSSFSLSTIGGPTAKPSKVFVNYALRGDHPPGESALNATASVVGRSHGSFSDRFDDPPVSGTFHC